MRNRFVVLYTPSLNTTKEGSNFIGKIHLIHVGNLNLFFRADLLLPLKQLPVLVRKSNAFFFLSVLPFHYFSSVQCYFSSIMLNGSAIFFLQLLLSCSDEIQMISICSHSRIFCLTNGRVRKCKLV